MPPNGVLVIDKPRGITSREVTTRIKRLLDQKKTGHLGTLDPLATGVLPIILGKATRFARFLEKDQKEYLAEIKLGETTDTLDAEGEIIKTQKVELREGDVREAVKSFIGDVSQVPPRFSALKLGGRPLYDYARKGQAVVPPARVVKIHEIEIIRLDIPHIELRVLCGPGTYMRSLARDLGERLGCGAHLAGLRRTKTGEFNLEQAVGLEGLSQDKAMAALIPMQNILTALPRLHLTDEQAAKIMTGKIIQPEDSQNISHKPDVRVLLVHNEVMAVAEIIIDEEKYFLKPIRVIPLV